MKTRCSSMASSSSSAPSKYYQIKDTSELRIRENWLLILQRAHNHAKDVTGATKNLSHSLPSSEIVFIRPLARYLVFAKRAGNKRTVP